MQGRRAQLRLDKSEDEAHEHTHEDDHSHSHGAINHGDHVHEVHSLPLTQMLLNRSARCSITHRSPSLCFCHNAPRYTLASKVVCRGACVSEVLHRHARHASLKMSHTHFAFLGSIMESVLSSILTAGAGET